MFSGLDLAPRIHYRPVSAPAWTLKAAWISYPFAQRRRNTSQTPNTMMPRFTAAMRKNGAPLPTES